jgi:hypothetical protein
MAETGLTLDLQTLRLFAVEQFYGGAGDYSALTAGEQSRVDRCINAGLRQFFQPPAIGNRVHAWSFLRKNGIITLQAPYLTGTVTIAAGVVTLAGGTFPSWAAAGTIQVNATDYEVSTRDSGTQVTLVDTSVTAAAGTSYTLMQDDYDLPEDFGFMLQSPTYAPSQTVRSELRQVSEFEIRNLRESDNETALEYPSLYAIRAKVNDPTLGSRSEILFWPNVRTSTLIYYRYEVRPDVLTTTNKYGWGASDHSETLKDSILSAFEFHIDGQQGPAHQKFMQSLQASIERDKRNGSSGNLGYNGNGTTSGMRMLSNPVVYRGAGDSP